MVGISLRRLLESFCSNGLFTGLCVCVCMYAYVCIIFTTSLSLLSLLTHLTHTHTLSHPHSSMVIRDLTLRSAASFGSFHLIRLLYDEYMFYLIEHKVARATGRTPIAVMSEVNSQHFMLCHVNCEPYQGRIWYYW